MDVDFMELRKGAIAEAKKTALKGQLTMNDLSVVKLMDVTRKVDWNHGGEGQPVVRPLETTAHSSAVLLQERGVKLRQACDLCVKTKNKAFQSCVCAPAFRRHALRLGACANCIWHGREAHCSLRTDFVASGGKKWSFTLDLWVPPRYCLAPAELYSMVLHRGGLLFTEGIGRRLRGLPGPKLKSLVPLPPGPLQSTSHTPAAIHTRKAASSSLTESEVESRRGDKSIIRPSSRQAGNSTSSSSTSVLGKRSASASAASSNAIEPPTKRTRSKIPDGKLVPWPCTSTSWNDPNTLKTIYSDLQRHTRAVKRRIEELDKPAH